MKFLLIFQVPFDARRLVFPPLPAALIAYALYGLVSVVLPEEGRLLILSGGLTGQRLHLTNCSLYET